MADEASRAPSSHLNLQVPPAAPEGPMLGRPLRILEVIDSLPQGGAEQLLVTLADHIDATTFALSVCSLHPLDEESPVVGALRARAVPIFSLAGGRRHDPRHVPRLASLLRCQRIDVVHTHLPYANTVGALAGLLARRPVIATLHSTRDARHRLGAMKQALRVLALRHGARNVIAVAPEVAHDARTRLRLPPGKLVTIPNGIDTQAFAQRDEATVRAVRRELLGEHAGPLVVSVGNLVPAKGHQHLVDAVPALRDALPDARVVIVGRPDRHERAVRARIAALGVQDHVLLAGPRRDIPDVLAAADLFVLPSLWEGLPLALLEAMAAGVPIVASAVGGVPGVIEDEVTGRLVPPGDAAALARAMIETLAQPDVTGGRAQAAREHVRATYGAGVCVQRLQSLYIDAAHAAKRCIP